MARKTEVLIAPERARRTRLEPQSFENIIIGGVQMRRNFFDGFYVEERRSRENPNPNSVFKELGGRVGVGSNSIYAVVLGTDDNPYGHQQSFLIEGHTDLAVMTGNSPWALRVSDQGYIDTLRFKGPANVFIPTEGKHVGNVVQEGDPTNQLINFEPAKTFAGTSEIAQFSDNLTETKVVEDASGDLVDPKDVRLIEAMRALREEGTSGEELADSGAQDETRAETGLTWRFVDPEPATTDVYAAVNVPEPTNPGYIARTIWNNFMRGTTVEGFEETVALNREVNTPSRSTLWDIFGAPFRRRASSARNKAREERARLRIERRKVRDEAHNAALNRLHDEHNAEIDRITSEWLQ